MPELPEVEAARRLAERHCVGKTISAAVVADDEKVFPGLDPRQLERALAGRRVTAAQRLGKHMWLDFDKGPSLVLHFGMTGSLVVEGIGAAKYKSFEVDDSSWPPRFTKLQLGLDAGRVRLAFTDSRRFARVRFVAAPASAPPISELRWDPLLGYPDVDAFSAALGRQRRPVKALLLDQAFTAGVGNWVADEALFEARIHPEQPAASLSREKRAALHAAVRNVCETAAAVEADAARFPPGWLFHFRWGKGAAERSRVGGHAVEHVTVGGRTSAFVPALQKLDRAAAAAMVVEAGGGPSGGGKKRAAAGGRKAKKEVDEEDDDDDDEDEAPPPAKKRGKAAAEAAAPAPPAKRAPRGKAPAAAPPPPPSAPPPRRRAAKPAAPAKAARPPAARAPAARRPAAK